MVSDNMNVNSILVPFILDRVRRSFATLSELIPDLMNDIEQNEDEIKTVDSITVEKNEFQDNIENDEDDIKDKDPVLSGKNSSIQDCDNGFCVPGKKDHEEMKVDELEATKVAAAEPLITDNQNNKAILQEAETPFIEESDGFAVDKHPFVHGESRHSQCWFGTCLCSLKSHDA